MSGEDGEEEEESYENSTEQGRRIGSWGVPGGAPPVNKEEICETLFKDPLFWYGRYIKLEKSYMDMAQLMESYRHDQRGCTFMHDSQSSYEFEKSFNRLRNSVGIFSSTFAILWGSSLVGWIDVPLGFIFTVAIALVAILDAIDLPGFAAKLQFW